MLRTLLIATFCCLVLVPEAAASWRWPVEERRIVGEFDYDRATPFLAGQRRGIELAVPAGARVRAACSGTVSFVGFVGSSGKVVATRCGRFHVSYLHLGSITARRGDSLYPGKSIGTVGSQGLYFGVRENSDRFGYVDPLELLGDSERTPPVGAVPRPKGVSSPSPLIAPRAAPIFSGEGSHGFTPQVNVLARPINFGALALGAGVLILLATTMYGFTKRYVFTKIDSCQYKNERRNLSRVGLKLAFANSRKTSVSTFKKRVWDRWL